VSQRESENPVSPFPSDTFDDLLRRAAAFLPVLPVGRPGPRSDAERCEFRPMLSDGGPTTLASLIEAAGVPESLFFMAVGWLARENKITIEPCHGDYEIRLK
jgi:hypothetical protein